MTEIREIRETDPKIVEIIGVAWKNFYGGQRLGLVNATKICILNWEDQLALQVK